MAAPCVALSCWILATGKPVSMPPISQIRTIPLERRRVPRCKAATCVALVELGAGGCVVTRIRCLGRLRLPCSKANGLP